jgi:Ycf66 protein N-terminus
VGFTSPAPILFGMILILAALGLFLTSKFKPDLYQESDNIYVVIGVVCGLLLIISLDLSFAMSFQQLLMIGALISITWQYLQVRAENKKLKGGGGRAAGRERDVAPARRSSYSARLDDEPEYPPASRGGRRFGVNRDDRQFQPGGYEEDYGMPEQRSGRMLPEYGRADRREESYGGTSQNENRSRNDYSSYDDRGRSSNFQEDDWSSTERPDRASDWERAERPSRRGNSNDAEPTGRGPQGRRRSSLSDSADEPAAKSTAYVDYEPIEPEEPVQFPSQ